VSIGTPEIILILVIALVVFGPKRLPEIGRTIGKSLRAFRRASQDLRDEFQFSLDDDLPVTPLPPPTAAELNGDVAEPSPKRKRTATARSAPKRAVAKKPAVAKKSAAAKRSAPQKWPTSKRSG
jgi:sec-independent protein translocase protein TatA